MKDFLLEAFPNPERRGCPDDETLKALAEDRLPANDPARLHLGSCSECFAEYRGYRMEHEDFIKGESSAVVPLPGGKRAVGRSRFLPWAIAASVLIVGGGGYLEYRGHYASKIAPVQLASSEPVNATVDLLNTGTLRGGDDPMPLQQVSLPATMVHLSVVLPRFSEAGRYDVMVSKDKSGQEIVAMGAGIATALDGKVRVDVTLDLRRANAGAYFLATVRGADNGTYYYPLKIN